MRVLHTADWHMNRKLDRQSLRPDIHHSLEQIAAYLEEYQVDVMVVAGDLLETTIRIDEMRQAVAELKELFLPFLERDGTIIVISGNHDNETFFETLRDALQLVAPGKKKLQHTDATGCLYIAPNARILRLPDRAGNVVQFVLMPYPTSRAYLNASNMGFATTAERHNAIQGEFQGRLRALESRLDNSLPSVLVSHIHVRGVRPHSLYYLSEGDDVIFEPGDIPTHWAYVAYGHIHKPQPAVPGATHIRYAGSIVKLDGSERDDDKSVVLCEIGAGGLQGEPQMLPLNSTPMYWVEITDPDSQIDQLQETYPRAAEALVYYTLHWDSGRHNRDALCRQVEAIFPRWYRRDIRETGWEPLQPVGLPSATIHDVSGTVRSYLNLRLAGTPKREELLALAEQLLAEEA
jgi:DNA repair protein SbcD/Mre11